MFLLDHSTFFGGHEAPSKPLTEDSGETTFEDEFVR